MGRSPQEDEVAAALERFGARAIHRRTKLQSLWSGYGEILRCAIEHDEIDSVIVKHVRWPARSKHPRGWNSDLGHKRKARSYRVEAEWYRTFSAQCDVSCRVPQCLALERLSDGFMIVLEDLSTAGFPRQRDRIKQAEIEACLSWLANFHATFMGQEPRGLWRVGTYWHLGTRPEELAALKDEALRRAATVLDRRLSDCRFKTFVHGDAKLANFCFSNDGCRVAAVDFQYVGGGCGMKDVAYFVSSCLDEHQSERLEHQILEFYFGALRRALSERTSRVDFPALEQQWRALYPIAWTDFYRFLQGWSPGHSKLHRYSERLAREVLDGL